MSFKQIAHLLVVTCTISAPFSAHGLTAVKPLAGYKCMSLNLEVLNATQEELRSGAGLPPVYAGPSDKSARLGTNAYVVIVASPVKEVNGFVEILRLNGQQAWISEKVLKPYVNANGSAGTCVPSKMSDGGIGFEFGRTSTK